MRLNFPHFTDAEPEAEEGCGLSKVTKQVRTRGKAVGQKVLSQKDLSRATLGMAGRLGTGVEIQYQVKEPSQDMPTQTGFLPIPGRLGQSPWSVAGVGWNCRCYPNRNSSDSHFTQKVYCFRTVSGCLTSSARVAPYRTVRCAGQRDPPSGSGVIHRLQNGSASGNF